MSITSYSTTSAAASRASARSITSCFHHRIPTRAPGVLSDPSHRSNSDRVEIYCTTVFWRRLTYYSIVKNPTASLAAAVELYLHVPYIFLRRICPVSLPDTWVWNPPRDLPKGGTIYKDYLLILIYIFMRFCELKTKCPLKINILWAVMFHWSLYTVKI